MKPRWSVGGTEGSAVLTGCPADWIHYRQSCYFLSKDMQSFDDAEAICARKSGSLVAMEDREEQVMRTHPSTPVGW